MEIAQAMLLQQLVHVLAGPVSCWGIRADEVNADCLGRMDTVHAPILCMLYINSHWEKRGEIQAKVTQS